MINFNLPKELIAQQPARPRDTARLLVYDRKTQKITDDYFYNLAKYLDKDTLVVANNSKVDHCRYLFNQGKKEVFALESVNDRTVRALVRPGKVFKLGKTVVLSPTLSASVTAVDDEGIRTIQFSKPLDDEELVAARHVPLPPYIKQNDELAKEYQTIYAKNNGSKAAPTAGLHFTTRLKEEIKQRFDWAEITLHVGLGTFAAITEENYTSGTLHSETYEVTTSTMHKIKGAGHITVVGTTTVRTLESLKDDKLKSSTDIFIQPGYRFKRVDSLITNFHLPSTSLLLLVEAFVGSDEVLQRIYKHAIAEKYRFYSFGDGMLIL